MCKMYIRMQNIRKSFWNNRRLTFEINGKVAYMSTPKRHFAGNALSYQKARPHYPQALFLTLYNFWKQNVSNKNEPWIVDIGCGTGIATRGIYEALQRKCKVIGIEPDVKMLTQAKQLSQSDTNISYLKGTAEKLPFEDKSVDIVIAAQAMQYFDRPLFYHEAKRILRTHGVIAIIENNRHWKNSPFLEQYEQFLEKNSYDKNLGYYARDYRTFPFIDELNIYFQDPIEETFLWTHKISPQNFLEMIKSSTSGQRAIAHVGAANVEEHILGLSRVYVNHEGLLEIPYIAKAYLAKN